MPAKAERGREGERSKECNMMGWSEKVEEKRVVLILILDNLGATRVFCI